MSASTENLRYPIGRFAPGVSCNETRAGALDDLAALPSRMRSAVSGLVGSQLATPYRPGGWTVRQIVHHVADSHLNGFVRVKLALTEDTPTIKPYDENAWAELADVDLPIAVSLDLLDSLHARWVALYRGMAPAEFDRTFVHPELGQELTLDYHLQMYAWHSRHHVAHVTELRRREGW